MFACTETFSCIVALHAAAAAVHFSTKTAHYFTRDEGNDGRSLIFARSDSSETTKAAADIEQTLY